VAQTSNACRRGDTLTVWLLGDFQIPKLMLSGIRKSHAGSHHDWDTPEGMR
jgi:hypothetical protein